MTCSQLVDIDSLVAGELDAPHAGKLRVHTARCSACRAEMELVTAERALFVSRAEAMAPPPPPPSSLVPSLRASPVRTLATVFRRGHFTAACAAALLMFAAFSRPGAATRSELGAPVSADGEAAPTGILASFSAFGSFVADETLACSSGGAGSGLLSASSTTPDDLGVAAAPSAPLASVGERVLACGTRAPSPGDCEPSVTCSSPRQ